MRRRQNPTGINQDSSTSVEVLSETGLVNVDGRLPRLLCDVALSAAEHAETRAIQRVVQALAARRCKGRTGHEMTVDERRQREAARAACVLPLLLLVVGARGPSVVMTDGRLTDREGTGELTMALFIHERHNITSQQMTSDNSKEAHHIWVCHTAPRSAAGSCTRDTTAPRPHLDSCRTKTK